MDIYVAGYGVRGVEPAPLPDLRTYEALKDICGRYATRVPKVEKLSYVM
jgi:hypothetical protein